MQQGPDAGVRIGELSRRVGVAPATLRAWERRYGLPRPLRSRAGQRLYGTDQERALRLMLSRMAEGFSPQIAARMALADVDDATPRPPAAGLEGQVDGLRAALEGFDERAADAALDRLLSAFGLDTVLGEAVLPLLHEIGERWSAGELTVGQEHFASAVLGGRLRALARSLDGGIGPRAVLACPPGERHELGLLSFGLALRDRGWRVTFLGADTPFPAIADAAATVRADLVVLAATMPESLAGRDENVRDLAGRHRVALGGRAATADFARRAGARLLPGDALRAAYDLGAEPPPLVRSE
jgi:methanogenic corrinoid protein MtbC1/transposase-like protein